MKTLYWFTTISFMLLCLSGLAFAADQPENIFRGSEIYESEDTISISNGGTELVFSLNNGQLLEWSTNGGDINSSCPECAYAEAAQMATEEEAAADFDYQGDPPIRLVLFEKIKPFAVPQFENPWVNTPPVFCGVSEWQIDGTYSAMSGGTYIQHTWRIDGLTCTRSYTNPMNAGFHDGEDPAAGDCELPSGGDRFLTIFAKTAVAQNGDSYWYDLEAVFVEEQAFGILAIEWPVVTNIVPPGQNDVLAWPWHDGVMLPDPIDHLLNDDPLYEKDYGGDRDPKLVWANRPYSIIMKYPNGHNLGMQFFTYYDDGGDDGYLFYANDTEMANKAFTFTARVNGNFNFSAVHYNNNVCSTYDPDNDNDFPPKLCRSNDFGPIGYSIIQHEMNDGNWMSAAKTYRDWVRSSDAPWIDFNTDVADRDLHDFYQYTGFSVFNAGSEFALADADPNLNNDNYLQAYYEMLFHKGSSPYPMLNFVLGWDFHHYDAFAPFSGSRSSFFQNGKCLQDNCSGTDEFEDWTITFGPDNEGGYYGTNHRMNRNAILGVNGSRPIGYLNPFIYGLWMFQNALQFSWDEWTNNFGEQDRTPWRNHTNYPPNGACLVGDCVMDPAQEDFFNFYGDLVQALVNDPYRTGQDPTSVDDRISGLYQDIGVTFGSPASFRSHPYRGTTVEEHRARYRTTPGDPWTTGHRVGVGGFVWDNQRQMVIDARDKFDYPILLGTEQMTELFVDSFDFYHFGGNGMGPLRAPTRGSYDDGEYSCNQEWAGLDYWLKQGIAEEIPMLQYVYHPMMPVRNGIVMLSGGTCNGDPSDFNIGSIFYWITAREYFEYGNMVELEYSDVEMDVLCNNGGATFLGNPMMPSNTPSYRLGWARSSASTETLVQPPALGKRGSNSSERTYGDPAKMAFLRMAAGLRSYIVPEFLVDGEMRKVGITITTQTNQQTYTYNHYGQRALTPDTLCDPFSDDDDDNYDPSFIDDTNWEHSGSYTADSVLKASWQNWQGIGNNPTKILHIITNLTTTAKTLQLQMHSIPEFGWPAYYRARTISGALENLVSWTGNQVLFNPGQTQTITISNIPAGGVALILVCDSYPCNYQL